MFLYNRILARRKGLVHALHRAARQSAADAGGSILLRFLGSRHVAPMGAMGSGGGVGWGWGGGWGMEWVGGCYGVGG